MTIDETAFRRVLGVVPTTVTVLTIVDASGMDRAMTVGAFTSLSLDPPLVLVCIGDDATIADPLRTATNFGISVLAEDQSDLSQRFADRVTRDMAGVASVRGPSGCALLSGAAAHLECSVVARYPGGDHTIVVGEVRHAESFAQLPLVHHRGGYSRLAR